MKIKNNLDFYNDFFNLLTDYEKSEYFYQEYDDMDPIVKNDMDIMKPDEFFTMYFPVNLSNKDENSTLKELITDILIKSRIKAALEYILQDTHRDNSINVVSDYSQYIVFYSLNIERDNGEIYTLSGDSLGVSQGEQEKFENIVTCEDYIIYFKNILKKERLI